MSGKGLQTSGLRNKGNTTVARNKTTLAAAMVTEKRRGPSSGPDRLSSLRGGQICVAQTVSFHFPIADFAALPMRTVQILLRICERDLTLGPQVF